MILPCKMRRSWSWSGKCTTHILANKVGMRWRWKAIITASLFVSYKISWAGGRPGHVKAKQETDTIINHTAYIKDHYTEELSLETLAEIFGYSPTYLSRMFQKYAGINYKSYLQSIRVQYAYQELTNTEHTISEIALNNGFPNSKALSKVFRKKYGVRGVSIAGQDFERIREWGGYRGLVWNCYLVH